MKNYQIEITSQKSFFNSRKEDFLNITIRGLDGNISLYKTKRNKNSYCVIIDPDGNDYLSFKSNGSIPDGTSVYSGDSWICSLIFTHSPMPIRVKLPVSVRYLDSSFGVSLKSESGFINTKKVYSIRSDCGKNFEYEVSGHIILLPKCVCNFDSNNDLILLMIIGVELCRRHIIHRGED